MVFVFGVTVGDCSRNVVIPNQLKSLGLEVCTEDVPLVGVFVGATVGDCSRNVIIPIR